ASARGRAGVAGAHARSRDAAPRGRACLAREIRPGGGGGHPRAARADPAEKRDHWTHLGPSRESVLAPGSYRRGGEETPRGWPMSTNPSASLAAKFLAASRCSG